MCLYRICLSHCPSDRGREVLVELTGAELEEIAAALENRILQCTTNVAWFGGCANRATSSDDEERACQFQLLADSAAASLARCRPLAPLFRSATRAELQ